MQQIRYAIDHPPTILNAAPSNPTIVIIVTSGSTGMMEGSTGIIINNAFHRNSSSSYCYQLKYT